MEWYVSFKFIPIVLFISFPSRTPVAHSGLRVALPVEELIPPPHVEQTLRHIVTEDIHELTYAVMREFVIIDFK